MTKETILLGVLKNYRIIETCELTHAEHGRGIAYVLDHGKRNTISAADCDALERAGVLISSRAYRYAPEMAETFVFVPYTVCNEFLGWYL